MSHEHSVANPALQAAQLEQAVADGLQHARRRVGEAALQMERGVGEAMDSARAQMGHAA